MKQVLLLRTDLNMSTGKTAVQSAHASVLGVERAPDDDVDAWHKTDFVKIALAVESAEQLTKYIERANKADLPTAKICDQGRTELPPDTLTAGAIGPAPDEEIDKITGELNLYN